MNKEDIEKWVEEHESSFKEHSDELMLEKNPDAYFQDFTIKARVHIEKSDYGMTIRMPGFMNISSPGLNSEELLEKLKVKLEEYGYSVEGI